MARSIGAWSIGELCEAIADKVRDLGATLEERDQRILAMERELNDRDDTINELGDKLEAARARLLVLAERVDEQDRAARAVLSAYTLGGHEAVDVLLDSPEEEPSD